MTESAIDTIARYLHALDLRDAELAGSCFAKTAEAWYEGRCVGRSRDEIVEFLSGPLGNASQYRSSTHALSNYHLISHGEAAEISSMVEVVVVDTPLNSGNVVRRGLLYEDRLHRDGRQWLIVGRKVTLRYQYSAIEREPRS